MDLFEGYVGIRLGDDQLVNDVLFSMLFGLLVLFALVFRANYRLFTKMVRDVFYVKERLSLFETVGGNEFVFKNFMTLQALFLCSLFAFSVGERYGGLQLPGLKFNLLFIAIIYVFILLFYSLKRFLYFLTGNIFAEPDKYRLWRTNYDAATGFWGILLYLPVFWILFVGVYVEVSVIMFVILYILYRFLVIYKTVRIFNVRGGGYLYIFLYLCGQEILPLIFIYKGMIYLYNFIEKSALWH